MTLGLVRQWFTKISDAEKDLPLVLLEGYAYTPRVAWNEVLRGSPLGQKLQVSIERRAIGSAPSDEETIAKLRLEQIFAREPEKPKFATLSGKLFTGQQLLEEIRRGTSIGKQWVNNEISHMKALVSLR